MTGLWQDLRHAVRYLVADPTYLLAASLALAMGIGVNIAVFSMARAAFFPSLPFRQANSLVAVYEQAPDKGISKFRLPYLNYASVAEQKKVFDGVALYISPGMIPPFDVRASGEPQQVPGAVVSANFFSVLGLTPQLGGTFAGSSGSDESPSSVIIGHRLWQELYGGSRSVLGKPLVVNQKVYDVIGVMPPGFSFPDDSALWLAGSSPSDVNTIMNRKGAFTEFIPHAFARLQPTVTSTRAEILLRTPLAHLTEPHLQGRPHVSLKLVPLHEDLYGSTRVPLGVLTAAAAFVLFIAWAVVSILCWVRAIRREKEIAVRATLGAGKWRAMRQLIIENWLVSVIGAAAAIVICEWTTRIIPSLAASQGLPRGPGLVDWHVLVYFGIVVILSAAVPGMWSAWGATKLDPARILQDESYSSSLGRGRSRLLRTAVAFLVGLAFILTSAATLLIENFRHTINAPLGWNTTNVWVSSFNLHGSAGTSHDHLARFFDSAVAETELLPAIDSAAIADAVPMPGGSLYSVIVAKAEGSSRELPVGGLAFNTAAISPAYFKVLGIPLLEGRWFTDADCVNSTPVAIVNQAFARYFWGESSPIGRRVVASRMADGRDVTVVGMVGTTRVSGHFSDATATIYTPIPARLASSTNWLVVKIQAKVMPPVTKMREPFSSMGGTALSQPHPAEELLEQAGALPQARAMILSLFGVLALVLAIVGSYGVTSYVAQQRLHEFGVRMALGATRGGIVRLLLGQTSWSLAMGLAAGWMVVMTASPVLRTLLYRARSVDISLFVGVSAILCCSVLAASMVPAWRVAALDPASVLRQQ